MTMPSLETPPVDLAAYKLETPARPPRRPGDRKPTAARNRVGKRAGFGRNKFAAGNLGDTEKQVFYQRRELNFVENGRFDEFSRAVTIPMMAAMFSVPARRSFSCPPPNRIGSGWNGDLINRSPAPLGP